MDPFEYFQQLKPQIEKDDVLMNNLRDYAFNEGRRLTYLGKGTANTHYRIGRIGNLWLATREVRLLIGNPAQIELCESYIGSLLSVYRGGEKVPSVVGGVNVKPRKGSERFFLLLEDLTRGGTAKFVPGRMAEISGLVDGEEVFYDFHENPEEPSRFMIEGKMVQLVE